MLKKLLGIGALLLATLSQANENNQFSIPSTISETAQKTLASYADPKMTPKLPQADDIEGWSAIQAHMEEEELKGSREVAKSLKSNIREVNLNGVPVLDITPNNYKDNGKVLVYTHGGAYTLFSAKSTLGFSATMAEVTGMRVVSVDYTTAPHAKWQEITDQVISVFDGLVEQGYDMQDVALFGDSAGGGLASGSVLKMRDQGKQMPSAIVLMSPWSDITETGDTYTTLKDAEPTYTYETVLAPSADAYADKKDQKHPYVSPVYADYSKGFPPVMIQGGTKEIFLSNFIRHYQALDTAGQTVKLDLYEGMPHVFQGVMLGSPESDTAFKKADTFFKTYLNK